MKEGNNHEKWKEYSMTKNKNFPNSCQTHIGGLYE